MPVKKRTQIKASPTDGSFFCDGKPFALPTKESRTSLEARITNRIRIMDNVTLTIGRKLTKTALKNDQLAINIGINPYSSEEECESSHHPLSPQYRYSGKDIRKLEQLLINDHNMIECTATLSYGDGGMSVDTDDDAESAIDILRNNYREPELILYF